MNLYVGIDPSYTNTGVVAIDSDKNIIFMECFGSPLKAKGKEADRVQQYLRNAIMVMDKIDPGGRFHNYHYCVEYPMVVHRGASAKVHETFALSAVAVSARPAICDSLTICYPYDWKKFIGTKHNANMKKVSEFIIDKYQIEFPSFDLYAAYGIALYLRGKILKKGS